MSIEQLIHDVQLDRVFSTSGNFEHFVTPNKDPFLEDLRFS